MPTAEHLKLKGRSRAGAARDAEMKYRALVESTDTGYLILDADGAVTDANKEYLRLTGRRSMKDILGRSVTEWTAPYDRERNAAEVRKCLARGHVRNLCLDYVGPGGRVVSVEINATVAGSGRSRRIISLCRDVTERNAMEKALRESEAKYRVLVEGANDIVYSVSVDGTLTYISPAITRYGWLPADLIGKNMLLFVALEDRERIASELKLTARTGSEFVSEFRGLTKKGGVVWFRDHGRVRRDADGNVTGLSGVLVDVTGSRLAADLLAAGEKRYRTLLEATFDLVFLLDRSGRFLYANPTTLRYLGKKENEVLGRKFQGFFPVWTRDEQKKLLEKVFVSGRPVCRERDLPFSGRMRTLETHAIPVKDRNGRVEAVLGVSRDITERKRIENVRLANKRLEMELAVCKAAQAVKNVPTLAHDVNNALTAINGYSALIYESLPSAHPLKGAVRRILKAVSRAYGMTSKLQSVALAGVPSRSRGGPEAGTSGPAVLEREL